MVKGAIIRLNDEFSEPLFFSQSLLNCSNIQTFYSLSPAGPQFIEMLLDVDLTLYFIYKKLLKPGHFF